MITENEIIAVGKTGKTHGVNGEITLQIDLEIDWDACQYIVFDVDSIFVPFFIETIREKNATTLLVKFDGIDTEPAAREFCGKTAYVKRELVTESDEVALDYFVGFSVIDQTHGTLGTIDSVDETTANALFAIGDLLIPVSDDYIVDIDHDRKVLTMNLPEGLVSVNG